MQNYSNEKMGKKLIFLNSKWKVYKLLEKSTKNVRLRDDETFFPHNYNIQKLRENLWWKKIYRNLFFVRVAILDKQWRNDIKSNLNILFLLYLLMQIYSNFYNFEKVIFTKIRCETKKEINFPLTAFLWIYFYSYETYGRFSWRFNGTCNGQHGRTSCLQCNRLKTDAIPSDTATQTKGFIHTSTSKFQEFFINESLMLYRVIKHTKNIILNPIIYQIFELGS
jgi:hypothetical protein